MKKQNIVVIGGANLEYLITSECEINQNAKNSVTMDELYAGSGLNYTLRLLSVGEPVYPILFVGKDYIGHRIQHITLEALGVKDEDIKAFVEDKAFLIDGVDTPKSTIIVEESRRTVLSHDKNSENLFLPHIKNRLQKTNSISSLIIGHIHSDKPTIVKSPQELSTIYAMEYFKDSDAFIYANLGASQIAYGYMFWEEFLPMMDILQLNIHEIKTLFTPSTTLQSIVKKLWEMPISVIITLDKFGAVGVMKGVRETLFLARPVELGERFVDSTGAGDAFCAGMVSVLNGKKSFLLDEFKEAMEVARSWAAYACMSYGGANESADRKTIDNFHNELVLNNEVLLYEGEGAKDILALIDATVEQNL